MRTNAERLALRQTFESVADVYGTRRPPLPAGLVHELVRLTELAPGARVLEVGPATGRLTKLLAAQGLDITALELGPELARKAALDLAPFENVTVINGDFDTWEPDAAEFDLVVSADAWHWLDPVTRTRRAATLVKDSGFVAIIGGQHVAGGTTDFFRQAQRCYLEHMPGTDPDEQLLDPDDFPDWDWDLPASGLFTQPRFSRWVTTERYTTASYLELIATFSGHIALEPEQWLALSTCLADLANREYGGEIERATLTQLCVARKSTGDA